MTDSNETQVLSEDEDRVFGGINQLNKVLHELDERGLILSLAAFAEDSLGTLLMAFMLPTDATRQLLEGFNAPLGTFSSRIKAAYSLGLIDKGQFEDLEHLRKIRNEFAHTWQPITFADPRIVGHIKAINYSNVDDEFPETPLVKVRTALSSLLVEMQSATHQIEKQGLRVQVKHGRLFRGFHGNFDQQIQAVREEIATIDEKLLNAIGEKRRFYNLLLKRLSMRLCLVEAAAPSERRTEVRALGNALKCKMAE